MSETQPSEVQVGAYFYPQSTYCGVRRWRRVLTNDEIGLDVADIPNELELVQNAQPLFEGHDQPRTYSLFIGQREVTVWDDAQHDALCAQTAMALDHGLSFFIFDSYNGLRNGEVQREMYESNRIADRGMHLIGAIGGLQFARMETLEGTRSILPVPMLKDLKRGFNGGFSEPERAYDVTPAAARFIVDANSEAWNNRAYLRVGGWRPYLSIMMPLLNHVETDQQKQDILNTFISEVYTYANSKYGEVPYIVGVVRQPSDVEKWTTTEVEAITQYCALPEYGPGSPPIQQYPELIERREAEWETLTRIADQTRKPFVPSVALGWDASPRGEQGYTLEQVAGLHPYTPIVVNNTPEFVASALQRAIAYVAKNVPEGQQILPIFAWNEYGEGASPVPRKLPDGTTDTSLLKAISRVIHTHASCAFCKRFPNHLGRPQDISARQ